MKVPITITVNGRPTHAEVEPRLLLVHFLRDVVGLTTIPRADMLCDLDVLSTVTPSPHHPLGVKGIGEAGTIASTCAVYNVVIDALEPFKVKSLRMPLTPERVWRAMAEQKGA